MGGYIHSQQRGENIIGVEDLVNKAVITLRHILQDIVGLQHLILFPS